MSDVEWLDLSGRGTCFRKGDVDAVGGLVLSVWWSPAASPWKWDVQRVNATGRTVKREGATDTAEKAKLFAEEAARSVLGLTQRTLWETGE